MSDVADLRYSGTVARRPCAKCPFLRGSMPGFLGGGDNGLAGDYLRDAHGEDDIACHESVDAALRRGRPTVRSCAGLATYRRNVHKNPRGETAAAAVAATAPDEVAVFATPAQFLAHHDTPANRSMMERATRRARSPRATRA